MKNGIYFIGEESFCSLEIKRMSKVEIIEKLESCEDREQVEAVAKVHSEEVYNIVTAPSLNNKIMPC